MKKQNFYDMEADRHWREVMALAEQYGFILTACGGTAVLSTHRSQLEELSEVEYLRIQQMNGHCPKDFGYEGCYDTDGAVKSCKGCWAAKHGAKWVGFEKNTHYNPKPQA